MTSCEVERLWKKQLVSLVSECCLNQVSNKFDAWYLRNVYFSNSWRSWNLLVWYCLDILPFRLRWRHSHALNELTHLNHLPKPHGSNVYKSKVNIDFNLKAVGRRIMSVISHFDIVTGSLNPDITRLNETPDSLHHVAAQPARSRYAYLGLTLWHEGAPWHASSRRR